MYIYEVGKPYPHVALARGAEEGRISFNEVFVDVLFYSLQPNDDQLSFTKGQLSVYLYSEKNIPFLIFCLKEFNFEVSLNILKVETDKVEDWLNSRGNTITMFLLGAKDNIIYGMRTISIASQHAEVIRDMLETQDSKYETPESVDFHIDQITAIRPTSEILKRAKKIF